MFEQNLRYQSAHYPIACLNALQRMALATIGARAAEYAAEYVKRLLTCVPDAIDYEATWGSFQCRGDKSPLELVADLVACRDSAGTCDLLGLIPKYWAEFISDLAQVFPAPPEGLERFLGVFAGQWGQYVHLVVKQFCARRSSFRIKSVAVGPCFRSESMAPDVSGNCGTDLGSLRHVILLLLPLLLLHVRLLHHLLSPASS